MKELIISLLTVSLLIPAAFADKDKKAASTGNIGSLIKQLDDDEFAKRESAGKELTEMGAAAIPALARATRRPAGTRPRARSRPTGRAGPRIPIPGRVDP